MSMSINRPQTPGPMRVDGPSVQSTAQAPATLASEAANPLAPPPSFAATRFIDKLALKPESGFISNLMKFGFCNAISKLFKKDPMQDFSAPVIGLINNLQDEQQHELRASLLKLRELNNKGGASLTAEVLRGREECHKECIKLLLAIPARQTLSDFANTPQIGHVDIDTIPEFQQPPEAPKVAEPPEAPIVAENV